EVDIKIEKLEKKKELLSQYKKGMMQKLFSQKLRFKDENGNDYPDWEEKKLGEIIKYFNGAAFPEKYQGSQDKKYPFYKVSDMNLFLNKKEMNVSNNSISEEESIILNAKVALPETVIFPKVGAALLTNKRRILKKISIFDNNIMGIIGTIKLNNSYLYYFMLTIDFCLYVQGGALPSISKKIIDSLDISLPSVPEQEKIAKFLSSIDRKIELVERELEKNKEFKNGLLQQMFV
ncbi:MAG: restriction endonuclease subunit S, partial [Cetobacterium sp.]